MRKPASERKDEMVAATLRLMAEVGPDRVSTDAVARAVGVTQAALFRHFPRKADLWMAVLAWLTGQTAEGRWPAAVAGPGAALGRLRALVRAQLDLIATTPAIPALLFSRELHAGNEALRQGLAGLMSQFHAHLAELLAEARAAGEVGAEADPRRVAAMITSLIPGTAMRWSLAGHSFDLVAAGVDAVEVVLAGLTGGEARRREGR